MMNLAPAAGGFRLGRYTNNPELADALHAVIPELFDLEKAKQQLVADAKTLNAPTEAESVTAQLVDHLLAGNPLPADVVTRYADEQNYHAMWQHTANELGRIVADLCQRQDNAVRVAADRILRHLDREAKAIVADLRTNPARTLTAKAASSADKFDKWENAEHLLERYGHIRQAQGVLTNKAAAVDPMLVNTQPVLFWLANPADVWSEFPEYVRNDGRPADKFDPENPQAGLPPWPASADPREFALWLADTPKATPWVPTIGEVDQLAATIRKAAPPQGRLPAISLAQLVRERIGNPDVGPVMGGAAVYAEGP